MTSEPISGDLLSASSLALAALAVFYGLWSPDIGHALDQPIPAHPEDRAAVRDALSNAYRTKAIPVAVGSIVVAILLGPPALTTVAEWLHNLDAQGMAALLGYNAVEALFVAVWFGTIAMSISSLQSTRRLRARKHEVDS